MSRCRRLEPFLGGLFGGDDDDEDEEEEKDVKKKDKKKKRKKKNKKRKQKFVTLEDSNGFYKISFWVLLITCIWLAVTKKRL